MSSNLSYQGFKNVLISQLSKRLEERCNNQSISVKEMVKDNDVIKDAISIEDGEEGIKPCIYLNDLYELYDEGVNLEEIIDIIKLIISSNDKYSNVGAESFNRFNNWEDAAEYISCRLVNININNRRLENVVYRIMGEFAIVYQIQISDGGRGFYTTQVTCNMLEQWGVCEETLYEVAMDNMKLNINFVLRKMDEVINVTESNIMFILTTRNYCHGAIAMISQEVREAVGKYINDDYYVLPSSVHELIILPKRHVDNVFELNYIVKSINRGPYVQANEFLSDNIYEYNRESKTLSLAGNPEMTIPSGGILYENCQCTGH